MTKLRTPLSSITAQGSIASLLTFSRRWGKNYVRKYNKPLKDASVDQATQRANFLSIIAEWNTRTSAEKQGWEDISSLRRPLSGYNIFLSLPVAKRNVRLFGNAKFGVSRLGSPVTK